MNPILYDIPEQFETKRLILRCPHTGDGKVVNDAIRESAQTLAPWLPFAEPIPAVQDTEIYIRRAQARLLLREELPFLIFSKDTKRFIGSYGVPRLNWELRQFEIGYWLRNSESGKGYMQEAVNGLVNFLDSHFSPARIEIRCDSRNARSARVAEQCGFRLEAELLQNTMGVDGILRNTFIFAKVRQTDGSLG